jgi:hypothetical protein
MIKQLLELYINKLVKDSIQEITARKGPRTGGFEFDRETVEQIMDKIKSVYPALANDPERLTKRIKDKVEVRSPITDKTYKIPLTFYWNPKDRATASAMPYRKGGKGLISINLAKKGDESWLRSTITHELTHLFDPQIWKDLTDKELSTTEYYSQDIEQKAFLSTLINAMEDYANEIKNDLNSSDLDERKDAKRLLKIIVDKPWRLYEKLKSDTYFKNVLNFYMETPDSPFMRKLNTAAYHITQNHLAPLV